MIRPSNEGLLFYMNFYNVALFINIKQDLIYKSTSIISNGSRVIVPLRRKNYCGIIIKQIQKPEVDYSIKNINEIIDTIPKIPKLLLSLSFWMSRYYRCPLGIVLKAMLPSGFNVIIQENVKLLRSIPNKYVNDENQLLIQTLNRDEVLSLRKKDKITRVKNLYYWLNYFEENKFIEIQCTYEKKIKKKIANFIVLNESSNNSNKLTDRQKEAFDFILSQTKDFPVSIFAKHFNYSILKALKNKAYISIDTREIEDKFSRKQPDKINREIDLTHEQKVAIDTINASLFTSNRKPFLIFGITGSGKTEIYIRVIKHVLQNNKTALMLVPEIALTPQMVNRFFNAFDEDIAILHSHLNDRNRLIEWKKIQSGRCRIVIGVRSAIFAPLKDIGVIIVDEEHETTYKQENTPRYNARDLAVVRGKIEDSIVILGSATPSLESWQNTLSDKYELIKLLNRPLNAQLPKVQIIDMTKSTTKDLLSDLLKRKIEDRLEKNEQVILFQNRRGYSSFVQCIQCGILFKCTNCDISMNYHSKGDILKCHYCGEVKALPRKCPECGSYMYNFGAPGTQQIEKHINFLFPKAKVLRMDSDTTTQKDSYDSMFNRMKNKEIDILLGTQMISKGLDFEGVTLVGVISADTSLNMPDFRAGERTFQLLTQVAGRSGRGDKKGEVIIQTYNPNNVIINASKEQDFINFAKEEMELRKALSYPPFYRIARLMFTHDNLVFLNSELEKNKKILDDLRKQFRDQITILGPVECPLPKIKNRFRYHIILKSKDPVILSRSLFYLQNRFKIKKEIKLTIDIDPMSLL